MVPILADPSVSDNFAKQKCNLNFSHRTDSDFIHFLLDTTISIVSVVKQISPVIKAIEEKIGPDIIIPCPDPVVCIPIHEIHHQKEDEEQCVELKSEFVDSNEVVAQLSEEMSLLIENLSSLQETANLTSLQDPPNLGSLQDTAALHQELTNTLSQHQAAQQSSSSDVEMVTEVDSPAVVVTTDCEVEEVVSRSMVLEDNEPTGDVPIPAVIPEPGTEDSVQCTVCSEIVTHGTLLEHMKSHENKGWHCHYCDKTFSLRTYLVKHKKRYHSDRRFRCSVCDRTYDSHSELQRHSQTHSLEAPFKCDTCSKKFAHYSSLKRHQVSHTGVKNYKCEMCGRTFMRKDSLNNHKLMSCPKKLNSAKGVLSGLSMLSSTGPDPKNSQQFLDAKILEVLAMDQFSN